MDLFEKQAQLHSLFQRSPVDAAYTQGTASGRRMAGSYQDLDIALLLLDKVKVAEYKVDKVPATAVRNGKDYGIRFYGLPAGYEFSALLDAIIDVSKGDSGLGPESKEKLGKVTQPVHLEVFVTPT